MDQKEVHPTVAMTKDQPIEVIRQFLLLTIPGEGDWSGEFYSRSADYTTSI